MAEEEAKEPEGESEVAPISAITTAVGAAAESSVGKSLLGPAATALGKYFGRRTEAWIEQREQRQKQNVAGHLEHIKTIEHIAVPNEPTERQADKLDEWAEFAQNIDPEKDTELAALWQALLSEIIRDDPDADDLIGTLRQLNAADAQALLDMSQGWMPEAVVDELRVTKLVNLGLLERYRLSRDRRLSWLFIAAAFLGLAIPILWISTTVGSGESNGLPFTTRQLVLWGLFTVLGAGIYLVASMFLKYASVRLTRLGRKLQEEGLTYRASRRAER